MTTFIEIEYDDGTSARWAIEDDNDPRIVIVEDVLGKPNTIKL